MREESEAPAEPICKTSSEVKREVEVEVAGVIRREWRWTLRPVAELTDKPTEIRCPYCLGPVRLHFKGIADKPTETHYEHLGKRAKTTDRYTCRAGEAYDGAPHMMSVKPLR